MPETPDTHAHVPAPPAPATPAAAPAKPAKVVCREHKFTSAIINSVDPPFRKVCEVCAHGEAIDETDPVFGDLVKKARA